MNVIIGLVVVLGALIVGFTMHGGNLMVLVQINEYIIMGGALVGTLMISLPTPIIKDLLRQVKDSLKNKGPNQEEFLDLLKLLFELCKTAKGNPLSLEPHVEKPEESEIFKRYPSVLRNHHAVQFLCDTLKVQLSSSMNPYDLEDLMDQDIRAAHEFEAKAVTALGRTSDAFPGLGIVAAVLGVVITMGKLTQGKEVIGHSVAAALVGTFLGILLCYGVFQPITAKMGENNAAEGKVLEVVKACLLAYAKDCSPKVCVEFARRTIPPITRPSFDELDKATSSVGKKAA